MGFPNSGLSTDILLSMATDNDFKDIDFCKKLIDRAVEEKSIDVIRNLLGRISSTFVFSTEDFRKAIIDCCYSAFRQWTFREIFEVCKESVLGNVLVIVYVLKKMNVITIDRVEALADLLSLNQIDDPIIFEYVSTPGIVILDLNESVKSIDVLIIEKAAQACELFFAGGKLEKSKESIQSMLVLYENSERPEFKFKGNILSSLLNKRMDLFLSLLKKISKSIEDEQSLKANFVNVYELLIRAGIPIFFESRLFKFENDRFYNANFYFALLKDKKGVDRLVMPFDEVDSADVQKVFDLENRLFVTPVGRIGKIQLKDIYSFRKVREVNEVSEGQLSICRNLSENEIEAKMRHILHDQNITSHSPAEIADIYIHKLFLNNELDLRDTAVIIKGRGYPKITLKHVASNILKAVDLPVQIVLLVHTGILFDEPREKFVNQCARAKKMYSIIDVADLTKLLLAYNCLNPN